MECFAKIVKGTRSGLRDVLTALTSLKMMEIAFHLILKTLSVIKISDFLSSIFGYVEKCLIILKRSISKFMTSQPEKQTIAIHILPNISKSKDNQTMKFGQLIYHHIRNIFLEKSYTKCGGETIPRTFSKKPKLSISLNQ